jgi:hypothetical protein
LTNQEIIARHNFFQVDYVVETNLIILKTFVMPNQKTDDRNTQQGNTGSNPNQGQQGGQGSQSGSRSGDTGNQGQQSGSNRSGQQGQQGNMSDRGSQQGQEGKVSSDRDRSSLDEDMQGPDRSSTSNQGMGKESDKSNR